MSGRRLVLLAGLAAGLILCMGCQGRPNPGATSTPPAAAKTSGNVRPSGAQPDLAATARTEKPAAVQPTGRSRHFGFRPRRLR